jgi:diguanylate cyclase (GGDEF)-like protein
LRAHHAHRADVVISAWTIPGMDGMELCRRIRALDQRTYTYLLFASGHANKRDVVEAIRAGADGYLPKPIDPDDLEARLIAAERVVRAYRELALRNAGLRRDSQAFFRDARTDPLTGVGNRLRLDEDLAALSAQMLRYERNATIAMCDLDAFKRYNDHYGHIAGDEVLRRIAHAIMKSVRRVDLVYRYGGEEFLVVLPEQSLDGAAEAMNRVCTAVERLGIVHAPGTRNSVVTVSIGLAALVPDGERAAEHAIACADRAMYRVKAVGGNGVSMEHDASAA